MYLAKATHSIPSLALATFSAVTERIGGGAGKERAVGSGDGGGGGGGGDGGGGGKKDLPILGSPPTELSRPKARPQSLSPLSSLVGAHTHARTHTRAPTLC